MLIFSKTIDSWKLKIFFFEDSSPKGFFWQVIRIFDFFSLASDSRYLQSWALNKLYSSRSFAFCFYKKYFRCVTLWSTISLAWLGVVDKLPFPLHPSVGFVTLSQFHFRSHCGFAGFAGFPSKVNIELSKRLKFTVRGFETVSKGFSFLLEKFGCGCTQRSRRQWNKGEQIFDLFCL